jgi:hypothetical protein
MLGAWMRCGDAMGILSTPRPVTASFYSVTGIYIIIKEIRDFGCPPDWSPFNPEPGARCEIHSVAMNQRVA